MSRFHDEVSAARAARVTNPRTGTHRIHRIAVVGTGMMGREHLRVAELLGRAEIAGIIDEHAPSVAAAVTEHRALRDLPLHVYPDLDALLADETVDAVIVSTPNFTHAELAARVFDSGKAMLLEKPMATRLADAALMVERAAGYGQVFQLGMQYRFKAQYVDLFHALVNERALGDVRTVAVAEYRPPFLDKVAQWNKFNARSGGTLVEKCCHYFDLMNRAAGGRPLRAFASGGRAVNFLHFEHAGEQADIDDHAFVIVDYENGVRGSFALNMFCEELYEEMVICGERGRAVATERATFRRAEPSSAALQVEVPGHARYSAKPCAYPERIESSGHYGATYFAQEAFCDRLEGGSADGATAEQGFWAIALASAAQASMASGAPIDLEQHLADEGVRDAWNFSM